MTTIIIFAAVHSYSHAVRLLEEDGQTSRAAGLCLELADSLVILGRPGAARAFYQRAADLRSGTILEYALARERVASCDLEAGDLHTALAVLTEVAVMAEQYGGKPVGAVYADVLAR